MYDVSLCLNLGTCAYKSVTYMTYSIIMYKCNIASIGTSIILLRGRYFFFKSNFAAPNNLILSVFLKCHPRIKVQLK